MFTIIFLILCFIAIGFAIGYPCGHINGFNEGKEAVKRWIKENYGEADSDATSTSSKYIDIKDVKKVENPNANAYPYRYKDLKENGINIGDIVVTEEWDGFKNYYLLRDGFPNEFNTALCCCKDERKQVPMHLYQIGFHYCGSTDRFQFRKATDDERTEFGNACLEALREPIDDRFGWNVNQEAQILGALWKYNVISNNAAKEINKELKKIHGVYLLKIYKESYS